MTYYHPTRLGWFILAGLTALTLIAMVAGCSGNPESAIIRDANRNTSAWIVDIAPVRDASKPSNSTGIHHIADAGKMVEKPVPVQPSTKRPRETPSDSREPSGSPRTQVDGTPSNPIPVVPRAPTRITLHLPKEILITGPDPCQACREAGRALERAKFRVKHDKRRHDWNERYGGPVFHFVCPNGKWVFLPPSAWADGIQGLIKAIDAKMRENGAVDPVDNEFDEPAADQRVAAAGVGLVLKPVVSVFLPLAKAVLGKGTLAVVWHRPNGAEVFPVWRGGPGDYSATAIGGATGGHIRFSGKDTNLPKLLKEYGAGYSISGDDITFYPDPLTVSLRGVAPGSAASPQVGFPVPSLIFGGLNLLFKALSVKAELQLGKDFEFYASMPADVLIVEVRKGPVLHAYLGFDRYASVTRIEVGPNSGTVFTPGAWPIPKRQTITF